MSRTTDAKQDRLEAYGDATPENAAFCCDRCGAPMIASHCKLVCLNCGGRLDCSDLSIYMDEPMNVGAHLLPRQ